MAIVPSGLVNQRKITAGVERTAKALSADVVRIRYDIGSDWMGNPALFFRIILTDKASRPANLRDVVQRVSLKIGNETKTDQTALQAYFSFRSQSEQAKLKEPEWDEQCHSRTICSSKRSSLPISIRSGLGRRA